MFCLYRWYKIAVFLLLGIFLFPFLANAQGGAALFLSPASGQFLVGSTFNLSIILDTKNTAANVVETELIFPSDKIQLINPSVGESIIQLWPAPPKFSNSEGKIYFVGGVPSPGVVTSQGVVLTLTFRVIAPGDGRISFGERTSVLANDGRGTNFLEQKRPAYFKFMIPPPQGPEISSPSHPDQEKWYVDNNPIFVWQNDGQLNAFSYSIDRNPAGVPDTQSDSDNAMTSFHNLDSGLWYFHLRGSRDGIWGGVSTYVLRIDNQPPAKFDINVSPANTTSNKNPIFRFFTTDLLSGFDHFEMKLVPLSRNEASEFFFFEATSPYQAIDLEPGRYETVVRATDRAGNTRDESITLNISNAYFSLIDPDGAMIAGVFVSWVSLLKMMFGILALGVIVLAVLWQKHKHHLRHAFREDIKRVFTGRIKK